MSAKAPNQLWTGNVQQSQKNGLVDRAAGGAIDLE